MIIKHLLNGKPCLSAGRSALLHNVTGLGYVTASIFV